MEETCANCGAIIGEFESPSSWQNHVICAACFGQLSATPAPDVRKPVVTSQTKKKWMLLTVLGTALVLVARIIILCGVITQSDAVVAVGVVLVVPGAGTVGCAGFITWWCHR